MFPVLFRFFLFLIIIAFGVALIFKWVIPFIKGLVRKEEKAFDKYDHFMRKKVK